MTDWSSKRKESKGAQELLESIDNKETKNIATTTKIYLKKTAELWEKKRLLVVVITLLIIVGIVVGASIFFGNNEGPEAVAKSGEKLRSETPDMLGELQITVGDLIEGSYQMSTLVKTETETGQVLNREVVTIIYEMIPIRVFNPTTENVVFSSIKLVDDLGNEYLPDSNPPDVTEQDFGRDMVVSPSTVREGNLFFLQINEDADKLQLMFELISGEKKVYEFDRGW